MMAKLQIDWSVLMGLQSFSMCAKILVEFVLASAVVALSQRRYAAESMSEHQWLGEAPSLSIERLRFLAFETEFGPTGETWNAQNA